MGIIAFVYCTFYLYYIGPGYIGGKLLSVDAVANRTQYPSRVHVYIIWRIVLGKANWNAKGTETVASQWFGVAIINFTTKPNLEVKMAAAHCTTTI